MLFSNELLWFTALIINFAFILIFYRVFGKLGLFLWIPVSVIAANIQVLKTVELFGFTCTLGNIVYATSFLVTDILSENHSKKDAYTAVAAGFLTLAAVTVLMNLSILFTPSADDFVHDSIKTIFSIMPRIAGASLAAFVLSQIHDIWAYNLLKKLFPAVKYIWLRNNASTMISQLIDSFIFTFAAFYGTFSTAVLTEIFITTYFIKWIVAALDTPCVYIASKWFRDNKIKVF